MERIRNYSMGASEHQHEVELDKAGANGAQPSVKVNTVQPKTTRNGNILVPQPSDDLNDPLVSTLWVV